jgi:hypothetical protein
MFQATYGLRRCRASLIEGSTPAICMYNMSTGFGNFGYALASALASCPRRLSGFSRRDLGGTVRNVKQGPPGGV